MMDIDVCASCDKLEEQNFEFVNEGLTDDMVSSLKANAGIKKSKYNIKHLYAVDSQTVNRGGYLATAYGFDGDQDYSKYGRGHRGIYSNRTPKNWGWEYGHNTVPEGYIYVQLRVSEIISPFPAVTFIANMPVVLDVDSEC